MSKHAKKWTIRLAILAVLTVVLVVLYVRVYLLLPRGWNGEETLLMLTSVVFGALLAYYAGDDRYD